MSTKTLTFFLFRKYSFGNLTKSCLKMSNVAKSYEHKYPIIEYCSKISLKQTDVEKALQEKTIKERKDFIMLGAPEVLQYGKHLIQLIKGKRCLDIGTFTGASAVAWALVVPDDGQVFTFDVDHKALDDIGRPFIRQNQELENKITFKLGPAVENMDKLIAEGEAGKWDFAFIDADKENYVNYYDRAMKLLRSGGIVLVDNALWKGKVIGEPSKFDSETKAIDECNKHIAADPNANSMLFNLGDGTHVALKNRYLFVKKVCSE